ncbi:MAG TPA: hypothetical protein VGD01_15305 [Candidatus Elarobacter sp.]|jgi:hypothetical protein
MLYRIPNATVASAAAALVVALGLGGCSSGGSTATVTHTPALQTPGGRATARSGVQAAILIASTSNGIALPGGPTPATIARRVMSIVHDRGRTPSATGTSNGVCINGQKQSQATNTNGSQTTITDYYFDAICTTLETEESITVNSPATPGATTGSGTITSYSSAGAVRVVQALTLTVTTAAATSTTAQQETFTMVDSASATAGGTATSAVGATCVGSPPSPSVTCSVAHYGTSGGATVGEAIGITATAGSGGGSNSAAISMGFFTASALAIVQSGASWGISGASAFNGATGTYTYTTTGSSGSGSLTLADSLYTYSETANLSSSGLTVTIIQNPNSAFNTTTPIATATVDVGGTGTISFSDGTSETIAGGLIGF